MTFLERIGAELMLSKIWTSLAGYKTHLLAWGTFAVVLMGHFIGPIHIGSGNVPQFTWGDVWSQLSTSGLFSALRAGVAASKGA